MPRRFELIWTPITFALVLAFTPATQAAPIAATDFDSLVLGATIVGPVGPEVESSLVDPGGLGLGDLSSSVSCPDGFAACAPTTAGAIFTYVHEVTPGVDFPNDPPFPAPTTVIPLNAVSSFGLGFKAEGFTGVAGYSFSQAANVLASGAAIQIEELADGRIVWNLDASAGWDTGETLTFFWQTTQGPSGPGGRYAIANAAYAGDGAGPVPIPVPEPKAALYLVLSLALALALHRDDVAVVKLDD